MAEAQSKLTDAQVMKLYESLQRARKLVLEGKPVPRDLIQGLFPFESVCLPARLNQFNTQLSSRVGDAKNCQRNLVWLLSDEVANLEGQHPSLRTPAEQPRKPNSSVKGEIMPERRNLVTSPSTASCRTCEAVNVVVDPMEGLVGIPGATLTTVGPPHMPMDCAPPLNSSSETAAGSALSKWIGKREFRSDENTSVATKTEAESSALEQGATEGEKPLVATAENATGGRKPNADAPEEEQLRQRAVLFVGLVDRQLICVDTSSHVNIRDFLERYCKQRSEQIWRDSQKSPTTIEIAREMTVEAAPVVDQESGGNEFQSQPFKIARDEHEDTKLERLVTELREMYRPSNDAIGAFVKRVAQEIWWARTGHRPKL